MANEALVKGEGSYFNISLYDMLHPQPADNRTAEQITADVIAKTGIRPKQAPSTE